MVCHMHLMGTYHRKNAVASPPRGLYKPSPGCGTHHPQAEEEITLTSGSGSVSRARKATFNLSTNEKT